MLSKKRGKSFYLILSIIALVLVSGYIFYRVKKQDFLDHQLKEVVNEKTHGIYHIDYDSISVDEVGGDLIIKNVYLKGDTALQKEMVNRKDTNASSVLFEIYVPLIKVVNFKTARALISKQMECSEIVISNPKVLIHLFPGVAQPKDKNKQQQELYKQLLGNFKLIKADSVSVINCEVTAADFYTKDVKFATFNTTVNLSQLAIDSTFNQDKSRTLFCKEITVSSEKVVFGDKNNTAEVDKAMFNTRSNIVSFARVTYDAFKNNGFFKTEIEGISLQGIEWLGPVENSELVIDKAIISKGELETLPGDTPENKNPKKKGKILTGWIKNFSLNSLEVKSVNYISRSSDPKQKPFIVKNNSFLIKSVKINRESAFNSALLNDAKEIELKNDAITMLSSDRLYEYKISGIKVNTRAKTISIGSLQVVPQLNEAAFVKKARYQIDRFDVSIRNVRCTNVNAEKLVNGEIDFSSISTSNNTVKVFRDLSYPVDSATKQGQQMSYPHQLLHKIGVPININKFTLVNTDIEYKEKNKISQNSGRVRFTNTNINITNVSSVKAKPGEKMVVNFTSSFLDSIPLTGGFTFSLDQWQRGVFTARASIAKPFDGTTLNQLTEPMGLIKIEKGIIQSVDFSMRADTTLSNGTLIMPYEDLKVSLLKKKGDEYKKKGVVSLLANLAVKNNNKEGSSMRKANVEVLKNRYRSFFNFIWMTVFKGLKDVAVLKL